MTLTTNESALTPATVTKHLVGPQEAEVGWESKDLKRDKELSEQDGREVSEIKRVER